jgi:hypothetical protein
MDDCFPNVAAGYYPGEGYANVLLPDLGEWTHGSWDVLTADPTAITMERRGDRLAYLAQKTLRVVDETTLMFSYRVENHGSFPIRYLWSAHPLIAVPNNYRLIVPGDEITFSTFPADGQSYRWPRRGETDLACEWIPGRTSLKVFLSGLQDGWCELQMPEYTIRLTFSLATTPVLGIWFNNYGFPSRSANPFRCIAVEPCTSPSDLLDDCDAAAYPVLSAGGAASWVLRMQIAPPE